MPQQGAARFWVCVLCLPLQSYGKWRSVLRLESVACSATLVSSEERREGQVELGLAPNCATPEVSQPVQLPG